MSNAATIERIHIRTQMDRAQEIIREYGVHLAKGGLGANDVRFLTTGIAAQEQRLIELQHAYDNAEWLV